jgi:hypothetical protein
VSARCRTRPSERASLLWLLLPLQVLWPAAPSAPAIEPDDDGRPAQILAGDPGDELPAARPADDLQFGRDAAARGGFGETGARAKGDGRRPFLPAVAASAFRFPTHLPSLASRYRVRLGVHKNRRPGAVSLPRGPPARS